MWVRVGLWNARVRQGSHHPSITTGQTVPWAPNLVFNSPLLLLAAFMIIISPTAPRGHPRPGLREGSRSRAAQTGGHGGCLQAPRPPGAIFGNKFHSHFLGTGQKVPGSGGDSVIKETPSLPAPSPWGKPPHPDSLETSVKPGGGVCGQYCHSRVWWVPGGDWKFQGITV